MSHKIICHEFRTPLGQTGLDIYMRNKRPAGVANFGAEKTLLFVHGATYPASVSFDLAVEGASWMDYVATRGFDVWLLDLPGYGRSSRPKEMDRPAKDSKPVVTTDVAIASVVWHLGVRLRDFSRRWAFWLETEAGPSLKLAVNVRLDLRIPFRTRPRFR